MASEPSDDASERLRLVQVGMSSLFEDADFCGSLLTALTRSGHGESLMDQVYLRVEDEIVAFVQLVTEEGMGPGSEGALAGFVHRLKHQILLNPMVYVEGC